MPFINTLNHCFIIVWDDFPYSTKLSRFSLQKNKISALIDELILKKN